MSLTLASSRFRICKVIFAVFIGYTGTISYSQQQGVLREVWANINGNNVETLTSNPNFPSSPTVTDVVPNFAAPINFGSNFGTRISAHITPTTSGTYKFWIQGDDQCALYFSLENDPRNIVEIASVPSYTSSSEWTKFPEQTSEALELAAGTTYYLEALHKEGGGTDHVSVHWSLEGRFERSEIPTSVLQPTKESESYDPTRELYVSAGADRKSYLPNTQVELNGSALTRTGSADDLTYTWTQTSGSAVPISGSDTLTPTLSIDSPGSYSFQLNVSKGTVSQSDLVQVTVSNPLAQGTGNIIQELWLGLGGNSIEDLINHNDYPTRPHLVRHIESIKGPKNWGDNYGVRTRGLITPPESADYVFYVMGDDISALFLSEDSSPDNVNLVAFTPERTSENAWTTHAEQRSENIRLVKGRKYYFESLFRENWGGDHHGVAWRINGGPIQTLGSEFVIPLQPETSNTPNYDNAAFFVVDAGANQEIYSPDRFCRLIGKSLKISESFEVESISWAQASGPSGTTIASPDKFNTSITFPSEGTYVFSLNVIANGESVSDQVTVKVLPKLSSKTGGFTREVWLDVAGGLVDDLVTSPRFPSRPDLVDQIASLTGPINWGNKYGSRSSGFLIPTRTGPHTFYLSADDSAVLSLSTDANRSNAAEIASSDRRSLGDYRSEEQVSQPISLTAGQRYYIEVLHKQNYGDDHFQVAISFGDEDAPHPIGGGQLEPYLSGISKINTALTEFAYAGPDRHYYAPTSVVDLAGKILRNGEEDAFHNVKWSYRGSVSGVEINNAVALETKVKLPSEGSYTFRLTLESSDEIHTDDVTITIRPRLSNETGGLLRAVWLNVGGEMVFDLLKNDPLLSKSDFEDTLPNLETPSNWNDYYGTRLVGYIHPPATGTYRFWLAANETAQFRISQSEKPNECVLAAQLTQAVSERQWDKYENQATEPILLEAGKKYFIEVLHKEERSSDHLSIAWTGPGLNDREIITAGYLSPAYDADEYSREILVLAGEDQKIRWPENEVSLFGRVFDHENGPQTLSYLWTASREGVELEFDNSATTNGKFEAPGAYDLTLTATDGENTSSDTVRVTVMSPLHGDAGLITREVWLDVPGYRVSDLLEHPDYPNRPDIVDTISTFNAPSEWADNYGQRIRGFILPPRSGVYTFYISADDLARVSMNRTDGTFERLKPIIDLERATSYQRWDQTESQVSAEMILVGGRKYPIEVLHKAGSGGDHLTLAWKGPDSEKIEVLVGGNIAPEKAADLASENLLVIAPADIEQRWPQNSVSLKGWAFDMNSGPESLTVKWEVLSGPGEASFSSSGTLETNAYLTLPGEYLLKLNATDGAEVAEDTVKITLHEPLSILTGAAERSIFTEVSGDRVVDLITSENFPESPERIDALVQLDSQETEVDHYGTLVTGYLHAPASGNYRFSVTGDDWAEVWLSSSESPEDKEIICFTPRATDYYEWDKYPEYQTSSEIALKKGNRYYIEVRHMQNSWRDHFSIAWLRPDQDEMSIVQGAYLSPLKGMPQTSSPRISIAGSETTILYIGDVYVESGFSAKDSKGIDISESVVVQNYVDTQKAGTYSVRYQVINPITGFAETTVRTVKVKTKESAPATYPNPTFTPPANVSWSEPAATTISDADASRFLAQTTFGPTKESISRVQEIGYSAWIDEQMSIPATLHRPSMEAIKPVLDELGYPQYRDERLITWWTHAITSKDQMRQRVAFALSQILVLSDKNTFGDFGKPVANYYDILVRNSFGDYRELLEEVTLNPLMGQYLTMLRSSKESPDENFPREIMQLFSIGLNLLKPDGSQILDGSGATIPTYDQRVILELSRAFTGWTYAGSTRFDYSSWNSTDLYSPMSPFDEYHDFGSKELMGGFILPQGLSPKEDLERSLDHIASHPNVGPFLALRLIQRLTTSNPSPAYIYRVAKAFDDDGNGNRGNLGAVTKAIFLDPEARDPAEHSNQHYGKLREPIIRLTHLLRAFNATSSSNPPLLGRYPLSNTTDAFGQSPLQAPSVFNFFLPDYAPPGEIMEAGLVAPEFATTTELTTVDTANYLHRVVERGAPIWYRYSTHIQPNLDDLITKAENTDALVDEIDILITSGSMSAEMRSILKSTLEEIDKPEARAMNALMLIISSPEFSIQK